MKPTPLYSAHVALGANMLPSGDWALSYPAGVEAEHMAVREAAGIQDLSAMPLIDVKGKGALALVDLIYANDTARLADGQMMYAAIVDDNGGFIDDGALWRRSVDHWTLFPTARNVVYSRFKMFESVADVYVTDVSSGYGGPVALQGPKSEEILQRITDVALSELYYFWGTEGTVAGFPCLIDRAGYTGEDGFELYPNAEDAVEVWNAVLEAGKDDGLIPIGLEAMDSLRIEKGLIGAAEYSGANPFECGLDRFVKLNRGDFIGREALRKIREEGVARRLVGLEIAGDEPASTSDPVLVDGVKVGQVTSASYGRFLKKNLALAFLETQYSEPGTRTSVTIKESESEATVATSRHYDPRGELLKIRRRRS